MAEEDRWTLLWDADIPMHGGLPITNISEYNNKAMEDVRRAFPAIRKRDKELTVR